MAKSSDLFNDGYLLPDPPMVIGGPYTTPQIDSDISETVDLFGDGDLLPDEPMVIGPYAVPQIDSNIAE